MQKDEGYCNMEIWKLQSAKNEAWMKWWDDWVNEITKTRVIDQDFRRLIASDRVFTCEKEGHRNM